VGVVEASEDDFFSGWSHGFSRGRGLLQKRCRPGGQLPSSMIHSSFARA
jgi:hypothetical protein